MYIRGSKPLYPTGLNHTYYSTVRLRRPHGPFEIRFRRSSSTIRPQRLVYQHLRLSLNAACSSVENVDLLWYSVTAWQNLQVLKGHCYFVLYFILFFVFSASPFMTSRLRRRQTLALVEVFKTNWN